MFWKAKNPHEKNLSNTLDKFKKSSSADEQSKLIKDFIIYVPDYTFIILYRHSKKLIELLTASENNQEPSNSVIDLFLTMVESYDAWMQKTSEETKNSANSETKIDEKALKKKNQEYLPYQYLLKESSFFDSLFHLTKKPDDRVLRIIKGVFSYEPVSFTQWFNGKKDIKNTPFMNLINMVVETKNEHFALLLHQLSVSHPNILKSLEPIMIPILKKLPLSAVIDFMMASKVIKSAFPLVDFEKWLLESQSEYTISDIEMISNFFNEIWLSETMIKMLVNSKPSEKLSDLYWISRKEPQVMQISQNIVREICDSLEKTSEMEFVKFDDSHSIREPYIFVRLYILSLCDPERVTVESQNLVIELIKDPEPFISAAATQCLIYWVVKFNYKFKFNRATVYRIASVTFSDSIENSLRYLYYAALHVLGKCSPVAAAIIQADENIRFKMEYKKFITRESWCFPHIRANFKVISGVKVFDYNQAKTVIDIISQYLADHIDHDSEYEYEYEYEYENENMI